MGFATFGNLIHEIQDIIKGNYRANSITLRFLGGTVGNVTMAVSDMQIPQEGQHGIYFVESIERFQVNPLYGWSQGHFIVELDATGNERIMTNKRMPITTITDDVQDEQAIPNRKSTQVLSNGIARSLVVEHGKEGLTVDEFKRILHERIEKNSD